MVRPRQWFAVLGLGLLSGTLLSGCYGNPFQKGDGSGTGTGRPSVPSVDQGRTGGLGSVRNSATALPPAGTATGSASSVGVH